MDDEQKREIVRTFILQAPPHEVPQVVKSVRVLVNDNALVDSVLPEACLQYNEEQFVPVAAAGHAHRFVICPEGRVDAGFLDPRTGEVFSIDHFQQTAESTGESVPRGQQEELRAKLEEKVDKYLGEHYRTGTASVFEAESGLVVVINSEKSNPESRWTGRWRSRTEVELVSETEAKVRGLARSHVHYYEEGNIQMESNHEYDKVAQAKSPEYLAGRIVAAISDAESEFHGKLDEMCTSLGDRSLKTLRRKLPVSKQLFDFSSNAYKLRATMGAQLKEASSRT